MWQGFCGLRQDRRHGNKSLSGVPSPIGPLLWTVKRLVEFHYLFFVIRSTKYNSRSRGGAQPLNHPFHLLYELLLNVA
jgi:hypothetical protein